MSNGIKVSRTGLSGARPDWMPDPGIHAFVSDFLEEKFNLQICNLNEKWVPLSIVGTLDWLRIAMWWFFEYTDVQRTNEQYETVFNFDGVYEFDADKLLVFRENPEQNAFNERWDSPGLTEDERRDVIGFISKYFESYEVEPPPDYISERIIWAVFLWVMSDYGKDWMYTIDVGADEDFPLFACVQDFHSAFVSAWEDEGKLLDPTKMYSTNRPVGTCAGCGERQWCVQGYMIQQEGVAMVGFSEAAKHNVSAEDLEDLGWKLYCNRCAVDMHEAGFDLDEQDQRVANPMCGSQTCLNTDCPHLATIQGFNGRKIPKALVHQARDRVDRFQEYVDNQLEGHVPRQLAGQTVDDMVDHFRR